MSTYGHGELGLQDFATAPYTSPQWGPDVNHSGDAHDVQNSFLLPQGRSDPLGNIATPGQERRDVSTVLHEHANALIELDEAIVQCVNQTANTTSRLDHCDAMVDRLQQSVEACFELAAASKRDLSNVQQSVSQNPRTVYVTATPGNADIAEEKMQAQQQFVANTKETSPLPVMQAADKQGSANQSRDVILEVEPAAAAERAAPELDHAAIFGAIAEIQSMQSNLRLKLDLSLIHISEPTRPRLI
eukprot:2465432-Rhodomonas_salina.1